MEKRSTQAREVGRRPAAGSLRPVWASPPHDYYENCLALSRALILPRALVLSRVLALSRALVLSRVLALSRALVLSRVLVLSQAWCWLSG